MKRKQKSRPKWAGRLRLGGAVSYVYRSSELKYREGSGMLAPRQHAPIYSFFEHMLVFSDIC
jgi:hypothetical protein